MRFFSLCHQLRGQIKRQEVDDISVFE